MSRADQNIEQTSGRALKKIWRAAEIEFAEKGFEGASMKALAIRSEVSQSLLHYHFGSKDKLYEAVIRERSRLINRDRLERLQFVDLSGPHALQQVFEALFTPAMGPAGGGKSYARIFAGLIAGNERDQALVRDYYDPTAREFVKAIQTSLANSTRLEAAQVYQFALGVLVSVISKEGRAERLVDENHAPKDVASLVQEITKFVLGGAKAIVKEK